MYIYSSILSLDAILCRRGLAAAGPPRWDGEPQPLKAKGFPNKAPPVLLEAMGSLRKLRGRRVELGEIEEVLLASARLDEQQ